MWCFPYLQSDSLRLGTFFFLYPRYSHAAVQTCAPQVRPMLHEPMASCRHHGLMVCLSQTHHGSLPARTPVSHSLTLPGAASSSQEKRVPLGSASTWLFLPLPRECFPAVPTKLICPPFVSSNFSFFLRQITQLKKSPSIKTCLTSSCLGKTMTFSPL